MLHYPMLLTMFFWPRLGNWGRATLVTYTLAMALTLVISGEHYAVDVLGGWAVAAITVLSMEAVVGSVLSFAMADVLTVYRSPRESGVPEKSC